VVHDTSRGGLCGERARVRTCCARSTRRCGEERTHKDDVAERTGREEEGNPLLDVREADVEAGPVRAVESSSARRSRATRRIAAERGDARDDAGLVDAAVELDNELARAVVVDLLELLDVACAHREVRQPRASSRHDRREMRDAPCFCITVRTRMMTLELGRTSTWRLPRFSALTMLLRQSACGEGGTSARRLCSAQWGERHAQGRRHAWLNAANECERTGAKGQNGGRGECACAVPGLLPSSRRVRVAVERGRGSAVAHGAPTTRPPCRRFSGRRAGGRGRAEHGGRG